MTEQDFSKSLVRSVTRCDNPQAPPLRSASLALLAALLSFCPSDAARCQGTDDGDKASAKMATTLPNIYLDLRTTYSTLPANTLSIGFSPHALFGTLPTLASLPSLSTPASQSLGIDVPLSVDVNDQISVYGGFSASASHTDISPWTSLSISSWNFGLQADVYQQNGESIQPSRCNRPSQPQYRILRSRRRPLIQLWKRTTH